MTCIKKKHIKFNMFSIETYKELHNLLLNNKSKKSEQPHYYIYPL